jgi:succinoglycan biosynthesis transport protein ExoP
MIGKNRKLVTPYPAEIFSTGSGDVGHHRPFMDVREFLSSLWRRKFHVIGTVILAMAAAVLYLYVAPKSYTATAQVLIDLNRPLTDEAQSVGADTTRFMMGPVIDSQVEIIRANRIARSVIEKTGYDDSADPTTRQAAGDSAPNEITLAALNQFQQQLDVRRKGLTLILLVQFTDRYPERAALVANTIVDEYFSERSRIEQQASKRAVESLKLRLAQARQDLTKNEEQLRQISEENNLFSVGGTTLDERSVAEAATQLNLARSEATRLLADLQQWEVHSDDKTGIATIGKIADARHNYEVARSQVLILEKNLADVKREYAGKSTAINRYLELQKEALATGDLYLSLAARIKTLETEQNYSMLDVQILDHADVPEDPSSPNVKLVLAGGLLGGLGLGLTLALMKDHMSPTVLRTPRLVQDKLGVPHIASLRRLHGRNADLFAMIAKQPNSPSVRSILSIHRFLEEARSNEQRVLAIVSANDGEGKSTIAAALAQYAASIAHQKTALVDCDVHQRTLSKRFAPAVSNRLAQAIDGTLTPARAMRSPDGCAFSFCAAPAEENMLSNIELLMTPGMTNFIKAATRKHDLIILDTPGLLNNVEARALVGIADLVILVIDARSTTVENIAATKALTPDLEGKLVGAVLNRVK